MRTIQEGLLAGSLLGRTAAALSATRGARACGPLAAAAGVVTVVAAAIAGSPLGAWSGAALLVAALGAVRPRSALLVVAAATVAGTKIAADARTLALRPDDLLLAGAILGVLLGGRRLLDPPLLGALLLAGSFAALEAGRGAVLGNAVGYEGLLVLARIAAGLTLYGLVAIDVGRDGGGETYAGVLLLAGGVVVAYGLLETRSPLDFVDAHYVYRTFDRGPWAGQNNHVAGGLAGLSAVALAWLLRGREPRSRLLAGVALALLLAGLTTTHSRQAHLAAMAGFAAVVLVAAPRWLPAAVLAPLALLEPTRLASIAHEVAPSPGRITSLGGRLLHWRASLAPLAEWPLLGSGLGSRHHGYYESQWVQVLSEGGVIGLALFVVGVAVVVRRLVAGARARDDGGAALCLGAVGFLAAMLVQGLMTVTLLTAKTAGPLAVMVGAALGSATRAQGTASDRPGNDTA